MIRRGVELALSPALKNWYSGRIQDICIYKDGVGLIREDESWLVHRLRRRPSREISRDRLFGCGGLLQSLDTV